MAVLQITAATSGTVNANDTAQDVDLIHDAGATVTLTVALPPNPVNGQKVRICSASGITTLTLSAAVGTIINAISTLAGGGSALYIYVSSATKWYKI